MTSNDVALPGADEGKRESRQRGRRRVMMGRRAGKTMRYYLGKLHGLLVHGERRFFTGFEVLCARKRKVFLRQFTPVELPPTTEVAHDEKKQGKVV